MDLERGATVFDRVAQRIIEGSRLNPKKTGEVPRCDRCDGTGIIPVGKRGFEYDFAPCPVCYVPPTVEARLKAAGIDRPTDFASWRDVPEMRESYDACQQLVRGERWFVFLRGGPGRGKTHLAKATARAFIEQNKSVFFRKVPRLLDDLRSTYNRVQRMPFGDANEREDRARAESSLTGILDFMAGAGLVVLDDFGAHQDKTQDGVSWAADKLYQIIDQRYEERLPLIVTTNVRREEERANARILDRLSPGAIVIKQGESRRIEYDR